MAPSHRAKKPVERFNPETDKGGSKRVTTTYSFANQFVYGRVLDAACGRGVGSDILAHGCEEVVAVDNSTEAINYAKKHYEDIKFICDDILEFLSSCKDRFDCVVAMEAIEHFDDDLGFVRLVYELLPREGVFVFSVPYLEKLGRNPFHKHFYYSKDKLIPYLKGFKYEFYYYKDATIYGELVEFLKTLKKKSGLGSLVVVTKKV